MVCSARGNQSLDRVDYPETQIIADDEQDRHYHDGDQDDDQCELDQAGT